MFIRNRALSDIDEGDLAELITTRTRESQTLEFKRESYGRADEDIREMLRDISSMCNTFGGDLLIGVDEDDEGVAVGLPGIENADNEAHRIVSSILSNIDVRLSGILTHIVPLNSGRCVLVIRIPRGHQGPHMITFKGLHQFWVRHDRQKSRMSVHEIKEACIRNENAMERLERFIGERQDLFKALYTPKMGDACLFVSATSLFPTQEIVDVRDSALREMLYRPPNQKSSWNLEFNEWPRPCLNGLLVKKADRLPELEVFRNGHVELRMTNILTNQTPDPHIYLAERTIIGYTVNLFRLAKTIYSHLIVVDPIVISMTLTRIQDVYLKRHPAADPFIDRIEKWDNIDQKIDAITVDSLDDSDQNARLLLDRVWQAYGFEEAPLFDKDGNYEA
jgi:hypothetical protein